MMDLLLRCLILSGKYMSKITANSMHGAYRRSIVLNDHLKVRYENLWSVIGRHENVLDLYRSNLEEAGNDPHAYLAFISDKHKEEFECFLSKEREPQDEGGQYTDDAEKTVGVTSKLRPLRRSNELTPLSQIPNFYAQLEHTHRQVHEAARLLWVNSQQFAQFEKQLCAKFKTLETRAAHARENLINLKHLDALNLTKRLSAVEEERLNLMANYGQFQALEESVGDEAFTKKLHDIREEVLLASQLLINNLRCFKLTDARIQMKKVKYNIINANHVLQMSQKECDSARRELVSKLLNEPEEEFEAEELETDLIPLPIEFRIKVRQPDINHAAKIIEINKRSFDELESNLKVVKIIKKNDAVAGQRNNKFLGDSAGIVKNVTRRNSGCVLTRLPLKTDEKYLVNPAKPQVPNNRIIQQSNVYKLIKQQDRRTNLKSNFRNEDDFKRVRKSRSKEEKQLVNEIHRESRDMSELIKINNMINEFKNLESSQTRRRRDLNFPPILEAAEKGGNGSKGGVGSGPRAAAATLETDKDSSSEKPSLIITETTALPSCRPGLETVENSRFVTEKAIQKTDLDAGHLKANASAARRDLDANVLLRPAVADWKSLISSKSLNEIKMLEATAYPMLSKKFEFLQDENCNIKRMLESLPATSAIKGNSKPRINSNRNLDKYFYSIPRLDEARCAFEEYDNSSFGNLAFDDFCLKDGYWEEERISGCKDEPCSDLNGETNSFADIIEADNSLNDFSCMEVEGANKNAKSVLVVKEKSEVDLIEERFKRVALARTNTNLVRRKDNQRFNVVKRDL